MKQPASLGGMQRVQPARVLETIQSLPLGFGVRMLTLRAVELRVVRQVSGLRAWIERESSRR